MSNESLVPWALLLSKARRSEEARVTRSELAGCDIASLSRRGLLRRASSAEGFRHPECEHSCVHAFDWEARREEGLVGVACPNDPVCWHGWDWTTAARLDTYHANAQQTFAALREQNGLAPLDTKLPGSFIPVGVFKRSDISVPVVWLREPRGDFELSCVGLRAVLGGDGLVVIVGRDPRIPFDPPRRIVVVELVPDTAGDLRLTTAIERLAPGRMEKSRQEPRFDMDGLRLRLAHSPDRHIVEVNGQELVGFSKSDLNFVRLWLLAAARAGDPDREHGGWVPRATLLGERSPDKQLGRLWEALDRSKALGLSGDVLRALVKSDRADGTVRLALHPSCLELDQSLAAFDFLAPRASRSKTGERSSELERNVAQGLKEARRVVAALATHGPATSSTH